MQSQPKKTDNRINATLYDFGMSLLNRTTNLGKLRRELVSHASGRTLEIGIGTGGNLASYPASVILTGIDPDPAALQHASRKKNETPVDFVEGSAMALPFEDHSFDTLVATLVFCTIPDPELALREAWRVLRPGGHFLLMEHVRSHRLWIAKSQHFLTPAWKILAGGCHLDRDPGQTLQALGFIPEQEQTFWHGLGKIWSLRKPTASGTIEYK